MLLQVSGGLCFSTADSEVTPAIWEGEGVYEEPVPVRMMTEEERFASSSPEAEAARKHQLGWHTRKLNLTIWAFNRLASDHPRQAAAIRLRVEGCTIAEISKALDMQERQVPPLIGRGFINLRRDVKQLRRETKQNLRH